MAVSDDRLVPGWGFWVSEQDGLALRMGVGDAS